MSERDDNDQEQPEIVVYVDEFTTEFRGVVQRTFDAQCINRMLDQPLKLMDDSFKEVS